MTRQFEMIALPDAGQFLDHVLTSGQGLALFDGLDEVNSEHGKRQKIIDELCTFSQRYLKSQCLITCRIAVTDYRFEGYTYVEMADFSYEQMQAYAGKWFSAAPTLRDRFLDEFSKEEHAGLRELGQVPLLLAMVCLAFGETLSFPQRRVEIYEDALDALLKKWDAARNIRRENVYRWLSLGRKRQMFARIAAQTFERGIVFMRQEELEHEILAYMQHLPSIDTHPITMEDQVDGETVLKAIEAHHGILVERAHRIYSFAHSTFQEYFTARYIVDHARQGTLVGLIESHLYADRWREVFLLTASMLDHADDFFEQMIRTQETMITRYATLTAMLRWAENKASASKGDYEPAAVRSIYLSWDIDLIRIRAHNRARAPALAGTLDRDRALARVHARELDLARGRVRDLARALDSGLDRDLDIDPIGNLDLDLALDFVLVRALALALELARDVDFDPARTIDMARPRDLARMIDFACTLSRRAGLTRLYRALVNLSIPEEYALPSEWQEFSERLHQMALTQRQMGREWDLDVEHIQRLVEYLRASQLFVDCLERAYVSDRWGLKRELLRESALGQNE
jgi:hypothetical protein